LDSGHACWYEEDVGFELGADRKGIAIGLNAAFLNIATEWLSDIKLGYCTTAFYLNESFCCSGAESGMHWPAVPRIANTSRLPRVQEVDRLLAIELSAVHYICCNSPPCP
jgi:hypothetical protein